MNKEELIEFLQYVINTGRISGDHDGYAGVTFGNDSYEKIAKDFIDGERFNDSEKHESIPYKQESC